MREPIPVTVLVGLLGSGKTTLPNHRALQGLASVRLPPLREGNQIGLVPLVCRGNLKERVFKRGEGKGEGDSNAQPLSCPLRIKRTERHKRRAMVKQLLWTPVAKIKQHD
jgi:hypothetical protein